MHDGAGTLDFTALLGAHAVEPNLQFLHRGVIEPKSGIGAHFHNQCEEMFVILDGEAEFTIDGHTSLLKGPAGAPCSWATRTRSITPPINRSSGSTSTCRWPRTSTTTFDLGDTRVGAQLDPIPQFITMRLDRALLRPFEGMHGGKGTVQYRRALDPTIFSTPWAYVDHLVLSPGASVGPHMHHEVAEVYYVMKGSGTVTVGGGRGGSETAAIKEGDAVPIQLSDVHSFENTGAEPLEFMIVGVARDLSKHVDNIDVSAGPGRRGGQ